KGYVGIALDAAPDSVSFNTIGQFVNSPLATGTQKISVLGTSPFAIPGQSRFGYFGAALNQTDEGVVFQNVQPNSPAGLAKLKGYVGIALDAAPDSVSFNTIGQFVNSPLATGTQKISVLGTSPFAIPGQSRFGYFGAALNQTDEGVVFQNVQPNSPAGLAKFK